MRFGFATDHDSAFADALVADVRRLLRDAGHVVLDAAPSPEAAVDVVFNVTRAEEPRSNYVRSGPETFVCTIAEARPPSGEVHEAAYPVLVRTMSNLLVYAVPEADPPATWLVTPELGFQRVPHDGDHARAIVEKVTTISDVTFVIDNELVPDLPAALGAGDETTEALKRVGRQLDGLGLLPSPLPLDELLSERDRRLLYAVFGVKQLSYGNLSARRDAGTFWMTGRGVNKSALSEIGRDMLLVTGLEEDEVLDPVPNSDA